MALIKTSQSRFLIWLAPLLLLPCIYATSIATFTDSNCKDSYRLIDGPNGYPNGTCTEFHTSANGAYSSFQVVGMDVGCTVTIYGQDTIKGTSCSASKPIFATIATCYNSSWVYYSIDECTPPDQIPSSTSTVSLLSGSATASNVANITSISPSPHVKAQGSTHTVAVAAGIISAIGGILLVSLLAGYCILRGRPRSRHPANKDLGEASAQEMPTTVEAADSPIYELTSTKEERFELDSEEIVPQKLHRVRTSGIMRSGTKIFVLPPEYLLEAPIEQRS